jgi:hypothetical protein
MDINSQLQLVFPARLGEDGAPLVWVYHTPISAEIFRANYRIIAAAKAELFKGPDLKSRIQYAAENGPVIGKNVLLDAAAKDAEEHDSSDMGPALIEQIAGLTSVLSPGPGGFTTVPLLEAVGKLITPDEADEVESTIVFFTCGYALSRARGKSWIANVMARTMMGSTTSLGCSAFAASLRQSTSDETSDKPAELSAVS